MYHRALFRAYFDERRDLCDVYVLRDVARASGVDDQGLLHALADGTYATQIYHTTEEARGDEIVSTPTFIFVCSTFSIPATARVCKAKKKCKSRLDVLPTHMRKPLSMERSAALRYAWFQIHPVFIQQELRAARI